MSSHDERLDGSIEFTPGEQAFRDVVETAMARLPRFLFRMYHAHSGGYRDLNTPKAITPLAFSGRRRGKRPSSCFYKQNVRELASIAQMHLRGGLWRDSVFSSWSQSLSWVLSYAANRQGAHVCILDTDAALRDASTVILHTIQMPAIFDFPIDVHHYELLAFGTIRGQFYQVISLADIQRLSMPVPLPVQWHTLSSELTATFLQALTGLCDDRFKLAMAAYCITICTTAPHESEARARLIRSLDRFVVPDGWEHDPKILNLENSLFHSSSAARSDVIEAAKVLRDLVRRSLAARPSREVLGLRIDATGWEMTVTQLQGGRSKARGEQMQ